MQRSEALFERALRRIPGGVNSPVRAFKSVGGTPRFAASAEGAHIFDEDGNRYIDYVGSWGPMVVGHAHPRVLQAVREQLPKGLSFGAPCELEVRMAERLCELMPALEMVRMVNSGTEATMSAIRLARGFTGRSQIVKFEGCYHGHGDALLVQAGSGALTLGEPNSPGVPPEVVRHTRVATYNDLDSVESIFRDAGDDIACVIVEPVAGNMNCVPPVDGFLTGLRELCDRYGAVLIFDEVMTGFRVALGGAQERFGVTPDLTTLGKVIGGGMPVGALGGRRDIMQSLSPAGPVYQAGTLSGNPVAMAAGLATLDLVAEPGFYERLEDTGARLTAGLRRHAEAAGVALTTNQVGAMFGVFFSDEPQVRSYRQATAINADAFRVFFHAMLDRGVWLAPSAFESGFVSAAHTETDIEQTLDAAQQALQQAAGAS